MKEYRVLTPAKINLHLEVTGRRPDGFHNLISLFQAIDLYDIIDLRQISEGIRVNGCPDIPQDQNLIYKAAEKFFYKAGITGLGVEFSVIKNIPSGAGLGGGSSDAAAALKLLNALFDEALEEAQLFDLGMELGSDVGFFLKTPAALVEGRGEKVTAIPPRQGLFGLVVYPDVHTNTALAYKALGLTGIRPTRLSAQEAVDQYCHKDPSSWTFFNDFYPVVRQKPMELALDLLGQAVFKSLSGSGSAVFGLYDSEEARESDFRNLSGIFPKTMKIKMLVKFPSLALKLETRG